MHNDRQNLGMKNNNNKQDWQIMKNNKDTETNKNKTESHNVTELISLCDILREQCTVLGIRIAAQTFILIMIFRIL